MHAIQIQAINDIIHWITLKIPCFDFAYLVSKQTLLFLRRFYISLKKVSSGPIKKCKNLACARDLAVVAFVILVEGAGGGIITGIDCVAGY